MSACLFSIFGGSLWRQCFVTVRCTHVQESVFRVENNVNNIMCFYRSHFNTEGKKGAWCVIKP